MMVQDAKFRNNKSFYNLTQEEHGIWYIHRNESVVEIFQYKKDSFE